MAAPNWGQGWPGQPGAAAAAAAWAGHMMQPQGFVYGQPQMAAMAAYPGFYPGQVYPGQLYPGAQPAPTPTPAAAAPPAAVTTSTYTMEQAQYYWQHLDYYRVPPPGWPAPPFPRPAPGAGAGAPGGTQAPTQQQQQSQQQIQQQGVNNVGGVIGGGGVQQQQQQQYQQNAVNRDGEVKNDARGKQEGGVGGNINNNNNNNNNSQHTYAQAVGNTNMNNNNNNNTNNNNIQQRQNQTGPEYVSVGKKKLSDQPAWRAKQNKGGGPTGANAEAVATTPQKNQTQAQDATKALPDSFKLYIQRVYVQVPGSQHSLLDGYIKRIWDKYTREGTMATHDWNTEPCPELDDLDETQADGKKNKKRRKSLNKQASQETGEGLGMVNGGPLTKKQKKEEAKKKKEKRFIGMAMVDDEQELSKRADRAKRFEREREEAQEKKGPRAVIDWNDDYGQDGGGIDWDQEHIVGTCTDLEKPYLRLTSRPEPSTVRPYKVLQQSLEHVKRLYNSGQKDYIYACEQFKSIRQDLTVQSIRNELTVDAYETHARVALKNNDLSEFNQCQTQLISLYEQGLSGSVAEFAAYRILYQLYTKSDIDLLRAMSHLALNVKRDVAVQHALAVRGAVDSGNYRRFFALLRRCPNLGRYIMLPLVAAQRAYAARVICKSYQPTYPVLDLMDELDFDSVDECVRWLMVDCGVTLNDDYTMIDCRAKGKAAAVKK